MTPEHRSARRKRLTGTDIAKVVGVAPKSWGGPVDIYLEKLGLYEPPETSQMRSGLMLETVIAQMYTEETGIELVRPPDIFVESQEFDWVGASLDYRSLDCRILVDCKNVRTAEGWGPSGTPQVPPYYLTQGQWQLISAKHLGVERFDLAVLIGGCEFRTYSLLPDEKLQTELLTQGEAFWQCVRTRTPPPIGFRESVSPQLTALLYPPENPEPVELGWAGIALANDWVRLGEQINELQAERDNVKAQLIEVLGGHKVGLLPDGRRVEHVLHTTPEKFIPAQTKPESKQSRLYIKKGDA